MSQMHKEHSKFHCDFRCCNSACCSNRNMCNMFYYIHTYIRRVHVSLYDRKTSIVTGSEVHTCRNNKIPFFLSCVGYKMSKHKEAGKTFSQTANNTLLLPSIPPEKDFFFWGGSMAVLGEKHNEGLFQGFKILFLEPQPSPHLSLGGSLWKTQT